MNSEGEADRIDFLILIILFVATLLMFECGCASPNYSPVPPASRWTNSYPEGAMIELPPEPEAVANLAAKERKEIKAPGVSSATASGAVLPAKGYWLAWDYGDTNGIVFEVHRASALPGTFRPWTNVIERKVKLTTEEPQGWFIVRASNTMSHLVSDWSTGRAGQ